MYQMNEIDLKSIVKSFSQRMTFYRMIESAKTKYRNITGKKIWYPSGTQDFNIWCENTYGLRIVKTALQTEYDVIDPKKYSMFLLKFSNEKSNSK